MLSCCTCHFSIVYRWFKYLSPDPRFCMRNDKFVQKSMVFPIKNCIDWKEGETNDDVQSAKGAVQSANFALNHPLKCKSCTLEEIAVLRVVQTNPTATQNQMAATIGKSERTVKSITVSLQEKGILRRVGGKRDGRWEITS